MGNQKQQTSLNVALPCCPPLPDNSFCWVPPLGQVQTGWPLSCFSHHLLEAEDKDQNSLWVRLIAYCKFFTLGFFWCGLIIVHMKVIKVCLIIDSINNSWTFTIDQALFYTFPDLWTCTFLHCILFYFFILLVLLCLNFSTDLSENILLMVLKERRLSHLASHT